MLPAARLARCPPSSRPAAAAASAASATDDCNFGALWWFWWSTFHFAAILDSLRPASERRRRRLRRKRRQRQRQQGRQHCPPIKSSICSKLQIAGTPLSTLPSQTLSLHRHSNLVNAALIECMCGICRGCL
ncbi:unnamed protein product [Ceratitis capitata]|uniref:(Mediterranean fruit fly) hypothetical protein n=1 Tax=Ceratitis capitata TaxID=7213 RepID=A0A811U1C2_CERCA|nr:unnamed protein product [Ceratitis capitata]